MQSENMLFGGSIYVGRLLGCDIRIHNLYLLLIAINLATAGEHWRFALFWQAMLFVIILCHEYGHCLAARAVGGSASEILMWPLGGLAFAHAPMTPFAQLITVVCGPLVNVLFCVISGAVLVVWAGTFEVLSIWPHQSGVFLGWNHPISYLTIFFTVNQWLLYFNMLPIYPLDGGQTFRALLWPRFGLNQATVIATQVGMVGAAILGIMSLQRSSALGIGFGLGLSIWIGMTCFETYIAARMGRLFDERIATYGYVNRYHRKRGFWARIFAWREKADDEPAPENPNPGGWERKQTELERLDRDVDRILQKVHDHGTDALSYSERKTLERASRLRKERDVHGGRV